MAFNNVYNLNVDIKRRLTSVVPTFKQGDSGTLNFRIYDDGVLYDLSTFTSSEITFQLPSGQVLLGNPDLVNGIIRYNLTQVEMAEVGKVNVTLSIKSGSTQVSIQPFPMFIFDSFKDQDISYIGILQSLITEVQNLELEVNSVINQVQELLELTTEQTEELRTLMTNVSNAEIIRESNETIRENNETTRQVNENIRIDAEITRESNETSRESNETTRENNENIRQDNESTRQSNELTRQEIINNLNSSDYTVDTTYNRLNIVSYNGSSYMALRQVINITPNDDELNWRLIAQRGVDGTGSVSSVNGMLPDGNGNVTIPTTTVIDNLTSTSTTSALSANSGREIKSQLDTAVNNFTMGFDDHVDRRATLTSLGHVNHSVIDSTLTVAGWGELLPGYSQVLSVNGILDTDNPIIFPVLNNDMALAVQQQEAWNLVSRAMTFNNVIRFECFGEAPTIDIPIQVKVIR